MCLLPMQKKILTSLLNSAAEQKHSALAFVHAGPISGSAGASPSSHVFKCVKQTVCLHDSYICVYFPDINKRFKYLSLIQIHANFPAAVWLKLFKTFNFVVLLRQISRIILRTSTSKVYFVRNFSVTEKYFWNPFWGSLDKFLLT